MTSHPLAVNVEHCQRRCQALRPRGLSRSSSYNSSVSRIIRPAVKCAGPTRGQLDAACRAPGGDDKHSTRCASQASASAAAGEPAAELPAVVAEHFGNSTGGRRPRRAARQTSRREPTSPSPSCVDGSTNASQALNQVGHVVAITEKPNGRIRRLVSAPGPLTGCGVAHRRRARRSSAGCDFRTEGTASSKNDDLCNRPVATHSTSGTSSASRQGARLPRRALPPLMRRRIGSVVDHREHFRGDAALPTNVGNRAGDTDHAIATTSVTPRAANREEHTAGGHASGNRHSPGCQPLNPKARGNHWHGRRRGELAAVRGARPESSRKLRTRDGNPINGRPPDSAYWANLSPRCARTRQSWPAALAAGRRSSEAVPRRHANLCSAVMKKSLAMRLARHKGFRRSENSAAKLSLIKRGYRDPDSLQRMPSINWRAGTRQ